MTNRSFCSVYYMKSKMIAWVLFASIQLLSLQASLAFAPASMHSRSSTALFGLLEWRTEQATHEGEVSPLLLLPYSESDILLPGQASKVVLKEGRHFDMVEEAIEDYQSIIGQAMMGDDQMGSTLSLCHIVDTDVDSGYRGKITMTLFLESVGRATLDELLRLKPVPLGYCCELKEDWTNQETDELLRLQHEIESVVEDLDRLSPNDETSAFQTRYNGALQALGNVDQEEKSQPKVGEGIESCSWAVFAALSVLDNSFERRVALESATVMDRLRYGLDRANEVRATKQRQADQYSLLDDGSFQ